MNATHLKLDRLRLRLKIPGLLTSCGGTCGDMQDQQEYHLNGKLLAKGAPGCRQALREMAGVKIQPKTAKHSVQKLNPLPAEVPSAKQKSWKDSVL